MTPNKLFTKFSSSGKVEYAITNFAAHLQKESAHPDFHPLMDFLKISPISYALTASPTIYAEIVQEMWSKADRSTKGEIKSTINGKSYIISPSVINEALRLPTSNFENLPTESEIISMLKAINYAEEPHLSRPIIKKNFRKEWSYFFETLDKVFSAKCSSYYYINLFVLKIAYSLLYGRRIDIGRLLLEEFYCKLRDGGDRSHAIFYARFLMIIANYLCKELSIEDRDDTIPVCMQPKNLFACLVTNNFHAEVEFVLPKHVQEQLSTLSSSPSHTSSSLVPPSIEDVREGHLSPTQAALPSPYQYGKMATSPFSQSGKRKKTSFPTITVGGNGTAPEVHPPRIKKYASEVRPSSSLFNVDQEMPPAGIRDGVPVIEIPSSPDEGKTKQDLFLIEAAQEPDDSQHLMNAASVLKSQLVVRLTSYADRPSTQEMMILANKCYNTLEGLEDNYISFSTEVNKLIAHHRELEFSSKKKENWNERDIKVHYNHQVQFLSDVTQKLSSAQDQLSTAKAHANSLMLKQEELEGALLKVKEELDEVEEEVKTLTAERDQCKDAHSAAEAELGKMDTKKEEARVAYMEINDQYNASKKEFQRLSNHLLQLVRK